MPGSRHKPPEISVICRDVPATRNNFDGALIRHAFLTRVGSVYESQRRGGLTAIIVKRISSAIACSYQPERRRDLRMALA